MRNKKLAVASVLLSAAMIIGIIENLIPPLFPLLPYVKIGFSNVVIILAILLLNQKYALAVIGIKSILVPIFVGNPIMILYSLPSGILAVILSSVLLYSKKISIPLISILSAVLNNIIQLCIAALMTNYLVFGYLPYFIIIGSLAGLATGIIAYFVIKALPKKLSSF